MYRVGQKYPKTNVFIYSKLIPPKQTQIYHYLPFSLPVYLWTVQEPKD